MYVNKYGFDLYLNQSVVSLQNPLLQLLVLCSQLVSCLTQWVSSIHLHSSCSVKVVCKDIRHMSHLNQVLEFGCYRSQLEKSDS